MLPNKIIVGRNGTYQRLEIIERSLGGMGQGRKDIGRAEAY